jgi:hypothetical protein
VADLKLPLVGPVSKKWAVIVLVASAGTVGYIVLRRRSAAASAASTASSGGTASSSDIDPLTGDVAGSAQDQADLAAMQAGGYDDEDLADGGLGDYGGYLAATPAAATIPGAGGFTTNGEWAQQAETDLGGIGIDQTTLAAALGAYLTGRSLTADQQSLVDQAIAEENYPPVSGADGYPPAMRTGGTAPSPVSGIPATNKPAGTPPNIRVSVSGTTAHITWGAEGGEGGGAATSYNIQVTPKDASAHNIGNRTSYSVGGLKKSTSYQVHISAQNSSGTGPVGTVSFRT